MKRILLIIVMSQVVAFADAQISNSQDFELSEKDLINGLKNMDPEFREKCANKIKSLLENNQVVVKEGNVMEFPAMYWIDKFNKYKSSIKKDKFEEEFFKKKIDYVPNFSNVKFYQLDNLHLLRVELFKKKVILKELTISPIMIPLTSPDNYTGLWKTYFINGSVSCVTEYLNGVKHGVEIIYNWKGEKSWLKNYENGKVIKLYSFDDGEIFEEDLEILEIEGEF